MKNQVQIDAKELADIVSRLLIDPDSVGELCCADSYASFLAGIAEVVSDHCGGEVLGAPDCVGGTWRVSVVGTDSGPNEGLGIWDTRSGEQELQRGEQS